jgi:hypothetical protein
MEKPKEITVTDEEYNAVIGRMQLSDLSDADKLLIISMCSWYKYLIMLVQETKITLKRLREMLGWCCKKISRKNKSKACESSAQSDEESSSCEDLSQAAANTNGETPNSSSPEKKKRPGHGRLGHKAYTGAVNEYHTHEHMKAGDICPQCGLGKMYLMPPSVLITFTGSPIIAATRHMSERLRCARCVFTSTASMGPGVCKYDPPCLVALAVHRYYGALPFYRLEKLQKLAGVPLPTGTQWGVILSLYEAIYPVFWALLRAAADADILHYDDTRVRILSCMEENKKLHFTDRKGMFTTGILAKVTGPPPDDITRKVVLFISGRQHAGENMNELLKGRRVDEKKLTAMSDALTCNLLSCLLAVMCKCLSHALRKFDEIEEFFIEECGVVLSLMRKVYKNEAIIKAAMMTPKERLIYHQEKSAPHMKSLKIYLEEQMATKKVEPNSSLGKAMNYTLKNWHGLTRFLEVEGAPIDNNEMEQTLKVQIKSRKNSLFYKTEFSAFVGSVLTSVIATCDKNGINPFHYLESVYIHQDAVVKEPEEWLPWNYKETLSKLDSVKQSSASLAFAQVA